MEYETAHCILHNEKDFKVNERKKYGGGSIELEMRLSIQKREIMGFPTVDKGWEIKS